MLRVTLTIIIAAFFAACKGSGSGDVGDTAASSIDTVCIEAPPRSSITFILGNDHTAFNQYYSMAGHYYRLNDDERTDVVVDNLTSLKQVLEYLNAHPPADSLPYGIVNLVSHGNEFIDLQMKVTPRGNRTSASEIRSAIRKNKLPTPDSGIVDSNTIVFLHGCAVGHNQELLDALAEAFGGRATVMASKLFEYYAYLSRNKNPQSIRHYYARTWYAFYHPDSLYDENSVLRQLQSRYPGDTTNWTEGLRRRFQDNPSQIYHYSFDVPCTYEETYPSHSNVPSVASAQKRRQWTDSHADFRGMLAVTHVPMQYFQTKFYRQTHVLDNDSILYGLKVKARAGVICLIRPLTAADSLSPYSPLRPSYDDTTIFAYSRVKS